jgi:regulator of nucleoside diphosphate kinase
MIGTEPRTIYVTQSNKARLEDLLDYLKCVHTRDEPYAETLEQVLDLAEAVAASNIPSDVITMNSQVRIRDLATGKALVYTLVFPQDADISQGRVSILAPIGTGLLGYRVGDIVEWKVPAGTRRLKVESVLYQPEASGDETDDPTSRARFTLFFAGAKVPGVGIRG